MTMPSPAIPAARASSRLATAGVLHPCSWARHFGLTAPRLRGCSRARLLALALLAGSIAPSLIAPAAAATDTTATSRASARSPGPGPAGWPIVDAIRWPEGTELIPFENLEGIILVTASVVGLDGRDTTGTFVVDTGAGYLALDVGLAHVLGVIDSVPAVAAVDLARRPLPRFALGALSVDQVEPVLTIDAGLVQRVTDRPVMGLLGQKPMMDRALWIDYQAGRLALVPSSRSENTQPAASAEATSRQSLVGLLSPRAHALPFKLAGDGKVIVQARLSKSRPPRFTPWLNWIVDTGSSKTVLFGEALEKAGHPDRGWSMLRGLSAPTLVGNASAAVARVPAMELRGTSAPRVGARRSTVRVRDSDVAILSSDLSALMSRATGETIHGLIGYSTLKRYRVVLDYPRHVMWLDPVPGYRDERPYEYSHVGIQLERREGAIEVVAVVEGSPAAESGIARGDRVVGLDGASADSLGVLDVARRLEGPPGSSLSLVIRRGDLERRVLLRRRRLL